MNIRIYEPLKYLIQSGEGILDVKIMYLLVVYQVFISLLLIAFAFRLDVRAVDQYQTLDAALEPSALPGFPELATS